MPQRFIGDDLLLDIRALHYQVFDGLREELEERLGHKGFIWLAIDPSYEDSTFTVMCTDEKVLLLYWKKAWNFYWESEDEMARELAGLYEVAAQQLVGGAQERKDEPGAGL